MGLNSANKIETNKYELEISVDKDKFAEAVDKAFKKNAKRINVPGFRRGKAPRSVIEKLYGEGIFYEDAVNSLYPQAYEEAVKEAGIEPVDRADIEVVDISKEKGVTFKAKVTVKPDVELGEYKGLKAVKKVYTVSDDEVNHELEHVRERNARIITVEDRAAQKGDIAVIDYEGFLDGKPFKGGKAEKQELELGSGTFIPGFEDQIIGHKIGENFEINVTFPENYHSKELAGKPAVFKIVLHELKVRELPELDDEFAKDVSEFDTLDEYKADIKKRIQEAKDKRSETEVEDALVEQIIGSMKAEIPEVMFERAIDNMVNDFNYRLQMQGMNLKTYLHYAGMEMDEFRKTFREQAERQVKMRLALEKIVANEKFEVTDEDLDAEYKKLAGQYGIDAEKIKNIINADDLKKDIVVNKAIDFVRNNAVITEEAATEETHKHDDSESKDKKDSKVTKASKDSKAKTEKKTTRKTKKDSSDKE
ncbi:MAG: trigger factor [[Clostridium] cellulosi]